MLQLSRPETARGLKDSVFLLIVLVIRKARDQNLSSWNGFEAASDGRWCRLLSDQRRAIRPSPRIFEMIRLKHDIMNMPAIQEYPRI